MVFVIEQEKKDNPVMFRATASELRFIRNLMTTENKLQSQILRELFSAGLEKLYPEEFGSNVDNTCNDNDNDSSIIDELNNKIETLKSLLYEFFELFFSIPDDRIVLTDSERAVLNKIQEGANNV